MKLGPHGDRILELLRTAGRATTREVADLIGVKDSKSALCHIHRIRDLGLLRGVDLMSRHAHWVPDTPAPRPEPEPPRYVVRYEGGVRITSLPPAPDRFAVELPPGGGQITRDWL